MGVEANKPLAGKRTSQEGSSFKTLILSSKCRMHVIHLENESGDSQISFIS